MSVPLVGSMLMRTWPTFSAMQSPALPACPVIEKSCSKFKVAKSCTFSVSKRTKPFFLRMAYFHD